MAVLALIPAILLAVLVEQNAVNVPTWDDWERGKLLRQWDEDKLRPADLWAAHLEHRPVVPRIVMLACNQLSGGDLRWEMALTLLSAVAASLTILLLLLRTAGSHPATFFAYFLINLVIFSPMQWENWLWATQTALMLPFLCLVAVVAVMTSTKVRIVPKFGLCLAAALVATLSFTHGFFIWPVVLCLVLLSRSCGSLRPRALFALGWLACFAAITACYFTNLESTSSVGHSYGQTPGELPSGIAHAGETLKRPERIWEFFVTLLGSPLSRWIFFDPQQIAPGTGLSIVIVFGLLAGAWAACWRNSRLRESSLPWLAIAGFSLVAALAIAFGRVEVNGLTKALSPRYTTFANYLLVAILGLVAVFRHHVEVDLGRRRARLLAPLHTSLLIGAVLFLALQSLHWVYGLFQMQHWRYARLQERAALLYIEHFQPQRTYLFDGELMFLTQQARYLNERDLLDPPLVTDRSLDHFKRKQAPVGARRARFDPPGWTPAGLLELRGHASLPGSGRPADAVLLTHLDQHEKHHVFALAEMQPKPWIPLHFRDFEFNAMELPDRRDFFHWQKSMPAADAPPPGSDIYAWALDSERMRIYPIGSAHKVKDPTSPPESRSQRD